MITPSISKETVKQEKVNVNCTITLESNLVISSKVEHSISYNQATIIPGKHPETLSDISIEKQVQKRSLQHAFITVKT